LKKYLVLLVGLILSGCAVQSVVMYEGEQKPDEQIAIIWAKSTRIESVNGKKGGPSTYGSIAVQPGEIKLSVYLSKRDGRKRTFSKKPLIVYFNAEAGKEYFVRPEIAGNTWAPLVIEKPNLNIVSYSKPPS